MAQRPAGARHHRRTAIDQVEVLEVILTAACNLRCTYCYQNRKASRSMSWATLRGALELVLQSRRRAVQVLFLGGEPLLAFPLIRRAVEYVRSARPPGKIVEFSIVTNGTLLRQEEAASLAAHGFATHLSFDGVPAAQDLRGPRTFSVLDALLDRLRRDHPSWFRERLTVDITLTPATVPFLRDSIAYFLQKGVPEIVVTPIVTHDPAWRPERIAGLDAAFGRVFEACRRHYARTGRVPLGLFRRTAETGAVPRPARRGEPLCAAPTGRNLALDVDGQVHGCAVFAESYQRFASSRQRRRVASLRMGHFRSPEFPRRLALHPSNARAAGVFHDKREKYSSYGRCGECAFVGSCSICPASIANIPDNADPRRVPDFPCAFNRVALAYREKFPVQPVLVAVRA